DMAQAAGHFVAPDLGAPESRATSPSATRAACRRFSSRDVLFCGRRSRFAVLRAGGWLRFRLRTITYAVATAEEPRARIMIRPGTYSHDMPVESEEFPITLWDGIQLFGTGEGINAASEVVLRSDQVGYFIWDDAIEQPNRVSHLTFTDFGGAFFSRNSRAVLEDVHVVDVDSMAVNNFWRGVALVYGVESEVEVMDVSVEGAEQRACSIRFDAGAASTIRRARLVNNQGHNAGDAIAQVCNNGSTLTLINSTIVDNSGGGVYANQPAAETTIVHSTVADNDGIGVNLEQGVATIANTILAFNGRYGLYTQADAGPDIQVQSNLFWRNADGQYGYDSGRQVAETADAINLLDNAAGNVQGDPSFLSRLAHNMRILGESAANGQAADAFREPIDKDLQPRGEPADIGAFETAN
ncbi:MAG: hypothetical protein ACI9U2_004706, partial [Bradymonadia bacterium]